MSETRTTQELKDEIFDNVFNVALLGMKLYNRGQRGFCVTVASVVTKYIFLSKTVKEKFETYCTQHDELDTWRDIKARTYKTLDRMS